ncbi:MAG: hypothetical protein NVS9B4_22020 [Candidatus Acidiferrum sp.]
MKLRIQANRIRVRLTQTEVKRIAAGQKVEQVTAFSPLATLSCCIESSAQFERPTATFENQLLTLRLPLSEARHWAESEQVGIDAKQPVGDGTYLHLLVEKDFACLEPRAEEAADAFPNPKTAARS